MDKRSLDKDRTATCGIQAEALVYTRVTHVQGKQMRRMIERWRNTMFALCQVSRGVMDSH